jgi:hypothetical protein
MVTPSASEPPSSRPNGDIRKSRARDADFTAVDVVLALGGFCIEKPRSAAAHDATAAARIGPLHVALRLMHASGVPVLEARVHAARGLTVGSSRLIELLDWNVRIGRNIGLLWSHDAISDGPQLGGTIDRTVLESSRDAADWVDTLISTYDALMLGLVPDTSLDPSEVPVALARAAGFAARPSAVPSADPGQVDAVLNAFMGGAHAEAKLQRLFLRRDDVPVGVYVRQVHGRRVLRVTTDLSPSGGVRDLQAVAERSALFNAGWPDACTGHVGLLAQSEALLHTTIVDPLHCNHDDLNRAIDNATSLTWLGRATFADAADLLGFARRLARHARQR